MWQEMKPDKIEDVIVDGYSVKTYSFGDGDEVVFCLTDMNGELPEGFYDDNEEYLEEEEDDEEGGNCLNCKKSNT